RFGGAVYYVPGYGAHRPVARKTLNKRQVEPSPHQLVASVMAHRPGSMVHAGTFFGDMLPSFSGKTPGRVYAFEPVLENYLPPRAGVRANTVGNVVLFHAGLGAKPGVATVRTGKGKRHVGGAAKYSPVPHGRRTGRSTWRCCRSISWRSRTCP